ncbi:hypothetical protein D9623_33585 (plasmid) [Azospirillum brasilense]|uniref:Uncharacterized protein n=1 Tax=Azospirillum brasilense TaxID=192 RepID=A0A4D8QPN1_AZOBR|nr:MULTISPECIES: hypothetical protein [Azospirillum]MDW7555374.1 hypothetical protein [Azospirillum brasilense]MDW7595218.1 hypothetical protein [Azospirillum brasilense]MDW7630371.1 hypothetical protein [Azospirillum brasilense]MDX5949739.1 hypothetical protein [Azospirillum brasilense]OPH16870.1 hypothetical protein FE89_02620 [Azospirillum brasilense]
MAKPRTMYGRKMVSLPEVMCREVDEYRFAHRFRNESDALRSLIEAGLRFMKAGADHATA